MVGLTHLYLLIVILFFNNFKIINSVPCNDVLCTTCCIPFSNGCRSSYTTELKGVLVTDNVNCKDCPCNHPVIGCGWIGKEFDKVECKYCKSFDNETIENDGLHIVGCGHNNINGELVYLD